MKIFGHDSFILWPQDINGQDSICPLTQSEHLKAITGYKDIKIPYGATEGSLGTALSGTFCVFVLFFF